MLSSWKQLRLQERALTINSEWWYGDGELIYADGDIGSYDHSAVVAERLISMFCDAIGVENRYECDYAYFVQDLWDGLYFEELGVEDGEEAQAELERRLVADHGQKWYDAATSVLANMTDAREFSIKFWDWIRIAGNNAECRDLRPATLKRVADAFLEVFSEEGVDVDEEDMIDTKVYVATYAGVNRETSLSSLLDGRIDDEATIQQYDALRKAGRAAADALDKAAMNPFYRNRTESTSTLRDVLKCLGESTTSFISPQISWSVIKAEFDEIYDELYGDRMVESLLEDARTDLLSQQSGLSVEEIESIKRYDPTRGSYLPWLVRQVKGGHLTFPEDGEKVLETLSAFDSLKRKSTFTGEKDVNKYAEFGDLWDAVEAAKGTLGKKEKVRKLTEEGAKVVFGDWTNGVIEVTTPEAGAKLFRDTAWCVKDPKFFVRYLPSVYYLFIAGGKRVALLHQSSGQFKGTNDAQLSLKQAIPLLRLLKGAGLLPNEREAKRASINGNGNRVLNSLALIDSDPEIFAEFVGETPT